MPFIPIRISTTLHVDESALDQPILVKLALVPRNFVVEEAPAPRPRRFSRLRSFGSSSGRAAPIDTITDDNCLIMVEEITEAGMWMIDMVNAPPMPVIDRGMHPLHWFQRWEEERQSEHVEIIGQEPQLDGLQITIPEAETTGEAPEDESFLETGSNESGDSCKGEAPTSQCSSSDSPEEDEEDASRDTSLSSDPPVRCPIEFLLSDWDADEHYIIEHEGSNFAKSYPTFEDYICDTLVTTTPAAEANHLPLCMDPRYLYVYNPLPGSYFSRSSF
ncbi:hypothetical protein CBS101457_002876 [Exobasidium rhododendri]|nr:hypothetical protein CBS101457_002876 [Exobasidium rhododendri]